MESSIEEIQNLICFNKIKAISLDTSTIQARGFNFESGMLKQLEQFLQKSDTELVISDVVKGEVQAHMEKPIKDAKQDIDKALKQAEKHWGIKGETIKKIEQIIYQDRQPKDMALERIDKFIEVTDSEVVEAEDNLNISDLLDKYFQSTPPFATIGKKKNEFPDAIALMSLESWARENETKILVVSKDNDWKSFCKNSDNLICINDLPKALELFQQKLNNTDYISKKIQDKYYKGELSNLISEINRAFEEEIYEFDIDLEVSSSYMYEEELASLSVQEFKFKAVDKPDVIFTVINYDDKENSLVVEASLSATIIVEYYFSFSVWDSIDKEDICIGASNVKEDMEFETEILITLFSESGEFNNDNDIEVEEIEFLTKKLAIDLGDVAPDMD
jgi:hypothetical protein